jgi:hypothetical protein
MTAHVISFDMTDALMSRATREYCLSLARELARPRDLLIVLASTALFASVVMSSSHWLWWFAGLPVILVLVGSLIWVAAFLSLPKLAVSRLARLPHRQVRIEVSEERLSFETAAERLEVSWSELKALKRRPAFWFICLRSGARIPVPANAMSEQALILLQARAASSDRQ